MEGNEFALTREQKVFYRRNGYLVVDGILPPAECDAALKIFEQHADKDYLGIMNLDRKVEAIRNIMKDPKIVKILETLQDAEVVGLQTMFLFKKLGSPYAKQAWNPHQDNAYPLARWGAYVTANIPFEDQDQENGCIVIYPGSHVDDVLPNEQVKSFQEAPGSRPGHCVQVPPEYKKVDLILKKGSVLILHGNVIHESYPNTSKDRSRPMLLIPYITKGESFIPGKTAQRMEIPLR